MRLIKDRKFLLWCVCVLLASFAFFGVLFVLHAASDLPAHMLDLQNIIVGKLSPLSRSNFLFFLTVYITALFDNDLAPLFLASSLVLAVAVTAKFIITRWFLEDHLQRFFPGSGVPNNLLLLFSLLILIAFSLPTAGTLIRGYYYLGQIPPNGWHNSTTIFLMPFALLLFIKSFQQLEKPTPRGILLLSILCILNILAKPSFFFVFCLVYPLMLLISFGLKRDFWLNLIPVVVGAVLLALQYYAIYKIYFHSVENPNVDVAIDPFRVWNIYSPNIPASLIASLVFPLIYLVLYKRDLLENRLVQYSVISYIIGLVIACTLIETGPALRNGNFMWQAEVCSYILFLVLLARFIGKIQQLGLRNWKNQLILATFLLHVLSGILYLVKFLYTRNFA